MKAIRKSIGVLIGTILAGVCALLLYALMCMNQTEELKEAGAGATPRPYVTPEALSGVVTQDVSRYFPYPSAVLAGEEWTLTGQSAQDERVGGSTCRVIAREYVSGQGERLTLKSVTPAAYMTGYADYTPAQGESMTLCGQPALYLIKGERACLIVRDGETLYILEGEADALFLKAAGEAAAFE